MSAQLQVTGEVKIRDLQGPVVANSGVITALDGLPSQYVRGDGTLADIPSVTGGGSSVSYYLNGSVNQGTFAGSTYYQMSKDAITGVGTNFSASTDGLLAQFITDANDPDVSTIPSGNWNIEFYMGVSASSGALASFYVEFYKWDGSAFTFLASNVTTPEYLTNTTIVDAYFTSVAFPETPLATTDRLAIRVYANVASKTVTMYTEDNRLCQIVTTFSKGLLSMNSLTDQEQYLTVGTAGTDFNIVSSLDTHTFNIPVASATNTGKLSTTDWSTFNNKQNALTNPITGTGSAGNVAYFNGTTSLTSENAFNYDASTNRLGVNTTTPNATIGANAATDAGYSLLLKNDNANYNGIGFGTDSTYGNLIATEKLGTALSRNLTLFNQGGYISLTEAGNLGVGILTPNTGLDIYNGTNSYLWLHTANSGVSGTDGVRLALFSTNTANLRNYEGAFSITAEGDFSVITLGAENIRVNSTDGKVGIGNPASVPEMLTVNGSIQQTGVLSALLKTNGSGKIIAAVAGTDYVAPSALSGYVPTSRTLTINGTAYDLSADRSWSVGTITGSGTSGQVPYFNGSTSLTSEAAFNYDASTNRLGVNTNTPNASIGANAGTDSGYSLLLKNADNNYNGIGFGTDSTYGNLIQTEKLGTAPARNLTLLNQSGYISVTEGGNLGVNTLNPAVAGQGIDIYSSTSAGLRLHTATSGTTVSDGAGINFSSGNNLGITNYENGTLSLVTNGNLGVFVGANGYVGINGDTPSEALTVYGSIIQTGVFSAMLKVNSVGKLVAAVAGTDYQAPLSNIVTGSSAVNNVALWSGTTTLTGTSNLWYNISLTRLGIGTNNPQRALEIYSATADSHLRLSGSAPSVSMGEAVTGAVYQAKFGLATAAGQYVSGAVAGDFVMLSQTGATIFATSATEKARLTSAGLFGIGTTNPQRLLHINAASDTRMLISDSVVSSTSGLYLRQFGSNSAIVNQSNGTMQFGTNDSYFLTIASTGAATFSSGVTAAGLNSIIAKSGSGVESTNLIALRATGTGAIGDALNLRFLNTDGVHIANIAGILGADNTAYGSLAFSIRNYNTDAMTEAIRINNRGNVGIGTSSPKEALEIAGFNGNIRIYGRSGVSNNAISSNLYFDGTSWLHDNTSYGAAQIVLSAQSGSIIFGTTGATSGDTNERMRITSDGKVGIGTTAFGTALMSMKSTTTSSRWNVGPNTFSSTDIFRIENQDTTGVYLTSGNTSWTANSDERLKNINGNIENALGKIMTLRTVNFSWKNDKSNKENLGLIAQDVIKVLPEVVDINNDEDKILGVKYTELIPVLIAAIKEQQAQIEANIKIINELNERIVTLESK